MVKFTNFCGIFATVFMVATAITIVSCSQDDDDYNSEMYTLAEQMSTRGYGGDWLDSPLEANTYIPREENCCCIYALTKRYIEMMRSSYFADSYCMKNATAFYNEIKNYLIAHPELQWTPDSTSMKLSTFYAIVNNSDFFVKKKPLYGETKLFTSLAEVQEYLDNGNNRKKVKAVILKHSDNTEHMVHVNKITGYKIMYDGYNEEYQNYNGGETYYNSVLKDGVPKDGKDCNQQYYTIIGVILE